MANAKAPPRDRKHSTELACKVFTFLIVIAVIASFAAVPYLLEIMRGLGDDTSSWELVPAIVFASTFLSAIAICIGLVVAAKVGPGAPILSGMSTPEPRSGQLLRSLLIPSIACGIGVSAVIYVLDPVLESSLMPEMPESARQAEEFAKQMPPWRNQSWPRSLPA